MAIDKAIDSVKLESNLTSIADAIRSKGGTSGELAFPAGFVSAIGAISAGGGVTVKTGNVTLETTQSNYKFVDGNPDIFIAYSSGGDNAIYSDAPFLWAFVESRIMPGRWFFGYNKGTKKYYVPYYVQYQGLTSMTTGEFSSGYYNSYLGATTYSWIAIYGLLQ